MEDDTTPRQFYAVRLEDDIPKSGKGMLIPYARTKTPAILQKRELVPFRRYTTLMILPVVAALFIFMLGVKSIGPEAHNSLASLSHNQDGTDLNIASEAPTLTYGVKVSLSRPNVFAETREVLIEGAKTFVEVDLTARTLRFFEAGVLTLSTPVLAKGEVGSWWQTPAGLYQVEGKKEKYFSEVGQVYLPQAIIFQGNLLIHGWPTKATGEQVESGELVGGTRIDTAIAKRLFDLVEEGNIILVHEAEEEEETFLYEPKVPELKTTNYLLADIKSSTVLASSDLDTVAPIASVTKLMTALVAAEHINLDKTVYANEPTFVQSLIPRLKERSQVSMYSLLQLLLVESSNEAAEVIAAQVGREEFIGLMNAKAKTIGMTNTYFADPSGLSSENTSSLGDLLRLAEYIYTNRTFIFDMTAGLGLKNAEIQGEFGELTNFNKVEDLENFIGGKVGETLAAGQTSVTLHKLKVQGGERVVAIVLLGSENRNDDVKLLLHYAEERFGE